MTLSQMQYYKQQKGYSLDQLSELSGVPRGTLQKIFSGVTKSPRHETLQALERVLRPEREQTWQGGQTAADNQAISKQEPAGGSYEYDMESLATYRYGLSEALPTYGKKQGEYTLEDYYAFPDDWRVELIDGVIYDMAAPTTLHQFALGDIYAQIRDFIKKKGGDCIPFLSPLDVQLDCDDKTMLQPDLLILCDRSKLIRRCIMGAPDFVIEVLSPSTKRKDANVKLYKYRNAGVREFWMIDLDKEKILVYYFEADEIPTIYGPEDEIPVGIYGGELKISMKELFEWVREIN